MFFVHSQKLKILDELLEMGLLIKPNELPIIFVDLGELLGCF